VVGDAEAPALALTSAAAEGWRTSYIPYSPQDRGVDLPSHLVKTRTSRPRSLSVLSPPPSSASSPPAPSAPPSAPPPTPPSSPTSTPPPLTSSRPYSESSNLTATREASKLKLLRSCEAPDLAPPVEAPGPGLAPPVEAPGPGLAAPVEAPGPGLAPSREAPLAETSKLTLKQKLLKRKAAQEEEAAWLARRDEAAILSKEKGLREGLASGLGKPPVVARLASAPSGLELAWDSGYEPLETRQSCLKLVTTPRPKAPISLPSPDFSSTSPSSLAFPSSPVSQTSLAWEFGTEESWMAT